MVVRWGRAAHQTEAMCDGEEFSEARLRVVWTGWRPQMSNPKRRWERRCWSAQGRGRARAGVEVQVVNVTFSDGAGTCCEARRVLRRTQGARRAEEGGIWR